MATAAAARAWLAAPALPDLLSRRWTGQTTRIQLRMAAAGGLAAAATNGSVAMAAAQRKRVHLDSASAPAVAAGIDTFIFDCDVSVAAPHCAGQGPAP
jgi:hypothetical protein